MNILTYRKSHTLVLAVIFTLLLIFSQTGISTAQSSSWTQDAVLTASDGSAGDNAAFGSAIAISGDTVVVGAPNVDVNGNADQGVVYVFTRVSTGWATTTETAKLTASDGATDDLFGGDVSISGDTIVVGAQEHNSSKGAAYVFVKPTGGWATTSSFNAKLTDSNSVASDTFGEAVSISQDNVLIGATGNGSNNQGVAYIFTRPSSGWATTSSPTAKLTAPDAEPNDSFGSDVAIHGKTAVIGAKGADYGANIDQGAVYVYLQPSSGWATTDSSDAYFTATGGDENDYLGRAVAVTEDAFVVGAPGVDVNGNADQGAAYVFVRPSSGWASTNLPDATLTTSDGAADDGFGSSVGIDDDVIVVGKDSTNSPKSVYVFTSGASWNSSTETTKITESTANYFGSDVAVSGGTIAIGDKRDSLTGAAYVYPNSFCSQTSGNWGSTDTWVGGTVPSSTDNACITTGDTVTVASTGAGAYRINVNPGATLYLHNNTVTVEDYILNNGTMQQSQLVNNANVSFLHLQSGITTKYRGVDIDATAYSENLGEVVVTVRETNDWFSPASHHEYCTTAGGSSFDYADRCVDIAGNDPTTAVSLRFWEVTSDLSISESNLAVYHYTGGAWAELTNRSTGNSGDYSYGQGDTSSFSPFLLGSTGSAPTAVSISTFNTQPTYPIGIIATAMALILGLTIVVWKLRRGKLSY